MAAYLHEIATKDFRFRFRCPLSRKLFFDKLVVLSRTLLISHVILKRRGC